MYAKRCSGLLDAVPALLHKAISHSSFSSIIVKRLRGKPLNIDTVKRSNRRDDKCGDETRSSKFHYNRKEQLAGNGQVEERNKKQTITKLCKLLSENLKNGKYDMYEKNLSYGLSVAKNPIELSQLINAISKGSYYSKGVIQIYTKLVNKAAEIFENVPVMSISLILNSMVKLDIYNEKFLFLFFKNVDQILDESNVVDLTILFHFYVNGMGRFGGTANPYWVIPPVEAASPATQSQVLLNTFLRRLHNVVPSLQMHGISSILRCVKKLVMMMVGEAKGSTQLDDMKAIHLEKNDPYEFFPSGKVNRNDHENSESNLELIKQINVLLRNSFYEKMGEANTQQLCNVLEDLQFFNLIDNDCYYDVLNRLRGSLQGVKEMKDIDYVNVLKTIKSRNIKQNDLLPLCYFSFLFDKLKVEDFCRFHYDRVAELAKILFYFKKVYHVNFCMNKMEVFLHKNDTNLIESTSTMIYLLDEFCTIGKCTEAGGSFRGKLFSCIVHRVLGGTTGTVDNATIHSGVNDSAKNTHAGHTLTLEESLLLTKAAEGLISLKKEEYSGIYNQMKRRDFFLINCDENVCVKFEHLDRYAQNVLYKILLLGKVRYKDAPLFLHLLKCCLLCSLHFSLKDILLLLRGLHHCVYFFTKENYILLENVLNYLSALIVLQCRLVVRRKECRRYRDDMDKLLNRSDSLFNRGKVKGEVSNELVCSKVSEAYRQIERVMETNWAYLTDLTSMERLSRGNDEVGNASHEILHLDEGGILSNSRRTKISAVNCCTLLYYFQRLSYVNKGVVRVVLSNLYDHVHALKNEQILKLVKGLSIIRNVDTEFTSFNSVFKKILLRFVSSHKESTKSSEQKTEETIKLLYLVSKLSINMDHRHALIRKYLLIFLERQLGEGTVGIPQLELLMRSFKNMYPYRYVCLVECCLRGVIQALLREKPIEEQGSGWNDGSSKGLNDGSSNGWNDGSSNGWNDGSSKGLNDGSLEGAPRSPLPLSFLKTYFSILPLLINPATNIHCRVNDLYMRTSLQLLDQMYAEIKSDKKLKEEFIPVLVTFFNLSFRDILLVERYSNLMNDILGMKHLIPQNEFFFFLLNVKFFGTEKTRAEVDGMLHKVGGFDGASMRELLHRGGEASPSLRSEVETAPLMRMPFSPQDFTFDRKKLVLLDTEDDNEMEIISREYNYIDTTEVHTRGERTTERRDPHRAECHGHDDRSKERTKRNNADHLEFEIILNKYAYCQNTQKDKIEISKNVKIFSMDVKYIDLKKRIIFEFLKEDNYFKEVDGASIELLPLVYLRLFFWRKLNYNLVIMPFYEWHMCYGRLERVKAIFQKLLNMPSDADTYLLETGKSRAFASVGSYE
ncbi:RAP protein, putative [Plasmodium knowlesi strain H]|uniref:RAP protein, putative n=3 Tax=Plasmodium knowlesi TaxID=5850 RepID=A0A5K1UTP8_PLAKH|nr:RAP protein, putative [Plasmodium knowlesi strain H]OTN64359.1 putative RAP protein [Plasmodium knowlesi]CAA9989284.1 RAP protein, putative [Plasmodium knowlesi strain H]SBO26140.1 RAP protein, putative [Plasmodium knowlesi strain H]SBO26832.1 RAP protein, putative [Plasmodium knowlesi strain H]VVS78758.1 RAP protein, putative [Plasmodium knowlesi strain H]|eukprot:XP_002261630.1 hypothetical protein, conserved in Plasmodium species [Plasmodium knowlesi strain H]